ncbi:hypothetical protein B0J17DRAFT_668835 [Rhizoctonia solani]|nr:hypothetical protein B0J17DRAFT_668835 [Rhizoctonia solani]
MNQSGDDANEAEIEKTVFLQLIDLEDQKAELPPDEPSRSELESTYDIIEDGIKATLQSIRDGRIAKAVDDAGREPDTTLLNDIAEAELQTQEERGQQLRLSMRSEHQSASPTSSNSSGLSNPLSATDPGPSNPESPSSTAADLPGPSSSQTATEKNIPPILGYLLEDLVECVVCKESTTEAYEAPCGCLYDRNCVVELFTKTTTDESLFPPKCCNQPIPFEKIRALLSPASIQTFEKKNEEFSTPNRLYCTNETCSNFLGSASSVERDKSDVICDKCSTSTCSFCKNESHAAHVPCKSDTATQQVLTLGTQNGWMACPECHHLVEKDGGCNDMVCRCGYEFCYACGVEWGSCRHG